MGDLTDALAQRVAEAQASGERLAIQGSGSKTFLGEAVDEAMASPLDMTGHCGIVDYQPGELVLTARAGTPLAEIEAALAAESQQLAFEPPHYGDNATLGGTIAAGVSGPARPFAGAARDFVLGTRIINGRGEVLRFGGEVMKNVAGYDLSRLMAGAFGTLGVLLDVSLKVLPAPRFVCTQVFECDAATAIQRFSAWGQKPWPITAAYWEDGCAYLRLAGAASAVEAARQALGGDGLEAGDMFWRDVREQNRAVFVNDERPLWRLSLAPATPMLGLDDIVAIDWGGAQRWLASNAPATDIRNVIAAQGGHASVRRGPATPRQHPLSAALLGVQQRLKQSMDPAGILNIGRLCPEF